MMPTTKISPRYTAADWTALRPRLDDPFQQEAWREAVDIARDRVANRFLLPVQVLLDHLQSTEAGFGFAMLALDCLLIDALQAFREGRSNGNEARSTKAFVDFLVQRPRFATTFISKTLAREFVESVRNGLLHDGETRQGWRVHERSLEGKLLQKSADGWVLYRNDFHGALEQEFSDYLRQLVGPDTDPAIRRKFLLRMDSMCGNLPERRVVFYFAYGSNMDKHQMATRVAGAAHIGIAHLRDYCVVFNKRSKDGTGKANIVPAKQGGLGVWGVVFELTKDQLKALAKHEQGYFQKEIIVALGDEPRQAITFLAEPKSVQELSPSAEYLKRILDGAKELPMDYQAQLRDSVLGEQPL